MRALLPVLLPLVCTASVLTAQRVLVVDPSGATPYRTIREATFAAGPGDRVHVLPGVYQEGIYLNGKSITIEGIGAHPSAVVVRPYGVPTSLRMFFHPAGETSRFANLTLDNTQSTWPEAVQIESCDGDFVFENVVCDGEWALKRCTGSVSMSSCTVTGNGRRLLTIEAMPNVFVHDCDLVPDYRNSWFLFPLVHTATTVDASRVEFSGCRLRGTRWGMVSGNYAPGGPALVATNSTVRITGQAADLVVGGDGHLVAPITDGGPGIVATGSNVTLGGVTVAAGAGVAAPPAGPPAIVNSGSTVVPLAAPVPVVAMQHGLARGRVDTIDVFAVPGSATVTAVALDLRPQPTPFGTLVIDASQPSLSLYASVPASGVVTWRLDLRQVPAGLGGFHYVVQSLGIDPSGAIGLSGPRVGVLGG